MEQVFVKTFGIDGGNIDDKINDWIRQSGAYVRSVAVTSAVIEGATRDIYTLLYVIQEPPLTGTRGEAGLEVRPLGDAPCCRVIRVEGEEQTEDLCMAGVFGVPEGALLSGEDTEPAPKPVFSSDFDIRIYKHWFVYKEPT